MPIVYAAFALAPYAGLLGLLYVVLSFRITNIRRSERIAFGHSGHAELERRVRAQANFAEYVPLALLLIWLAGATGSPAPIVNLLGLILLLGRLFHAYSILVHEPGTGRYRLRTAGMVLTFAALIIPSLLLVLHWVKFSLLLAH